MLLNVPYRARSPEIHAIPAASAAFGCAAGTFAPATVTTRGATNAR